MSVEGPIVATEETVRAEERRALAHRYLAAKAATSIWYLAAPEDDALSTVLFRMAPHRWLTTDFAKQFA